jgi:hypothetical protein
MRTNRVWIAAFVVCFGAACADSITAPPDAGVGAAGSGTAASGASAGSGSSAGAGGAGTSGASGGAGAAGSVGGVGGGPAGAGAGGASGAGAGGLGGAGVGGQGGAGMGGAAGASGSGGAGVDAGPPSICDLEFDPGPCDAAIQVYRYDARSQTCERATYGGCEGNDNRFMTLAECQTACVDERFIACDSDADCGWGEIGHEIETRFDCICLFGCPYIPLNTATIQRRLDQHSMLCEPSRDGQGNPCPIDDCIMPAPAMCIDGRCGGDPFGGN